LVHKEVAVQSKIALPVYIIVPMPVVVEVTVLEIILASQVFFFVDDEFDKVAAGGNGTHQRNYPFEGGFIRFCEWPVVERVAGAAIAAVGAFGVIKGRRI
jgi:hypothetical protein